MSVLFDHTNMTSNIGHFPENGPQTTMAKGVSDKGLFPIKISNSICQPQALAAFPTWTTRKKNHVWHRRTHIGDTALERSMKLGTTDGLDIDLLDKSEPCTCESCVITKMHRIPHPQSEGAKYAPQNLLGVVTADIIVFSLNNVSLGGNRYWLSITVPNALGFHFGFGLKRKSDATHYLQ
ncbi:hypothetical protein HDU80_002532 [Chytriomyces hyalinus]|nr:hypothetical protein HDU80_002532 [Chytriomyces hyalinus]